MATANSLPTQPPRLSVALIVRDEAGFLDATLESVRAIADEIVVLDTGSTDDTPTRAKQNGAIVEQMAWSDDFSAARNRCLEIVTGDWVLWLDAGERVDPRTLRDLRSFIDQQASQDTVYLVMVEIPSADPRASNEQAACERLMPSRSDLRFTGRVRETLRPAMGKAGLKVALAPGRIVRHARQHDAQRKARHVQRNLDLITREAAELGDYPPRLLLAIGDVFTELGNREGARNAFLQTIGKTAKGSVEMLEAYYGLLTALGSEEQRHLQLSTCLEALEVFPTDAQLLMAMGNYLRMHGRYDMAVRSFETAVRQGRISIETWHLCELGEMAAICLSLTYQVLRNTDQAIATLQHAAAAYPASNRVKRYWTELLAAQGKYDEAMRIVDQLTVGRQLQQAIREAVVGARHFADKQWTEALMNLQRSYVNGFREPFNLRYLALTLLEHGHKEAARPILQEWLELDPHSSEARHYLGIASPEQAATPSGTETVASRRVRVDSKQAGPQSSAATPTNPKARRGR